MVDIKILAIVGEKTAPIAVPFLLEGKVIEGEVVVVNVCV